MSNDRKIQFRALVEVASPISAEEAIRRAEAFPSPLHERPARNGQQSRRFAVAAAALALVGAGAGWGFAALHTQPVIEHGPLGAPKPLPKLILTATDVHRIAAHSSAAAASSGTAMVHKTTAINGHAQSSEDVAVTFSGKNVDEKITTTPEPAASAKPFTTDDRFVDGQFYIYTPGPGDVLEWLHDTNSANDAASMQFPDPRSLYDAINPEAKFSAVGTTTINAETVTRLVAGDPAAIDTTTLGSFASGRTISSFELWVDENDVVQQIALATSQVNQGCRFKPLSAATLKNLAKQYGDKVPMPAIRQASGGSCAIEDWTTTATVSFANLGSLQSVVAPPNPVDYDGKG